MSTNFQKVRDYLFDLGYGITEQDEAEQLFIVENPESGITNLIIDCEDPLLVIELYLFDREGNDYEMLEQLLMKNREIIHGAFALDDTGKKVLFRDTLQLETLDQDELDATLNSLELLLSEYSEQLIRFSKHQPVKENAK